MRLDSSNRKRWILGIVCDKQEWIVCSFYTQVSWDVKISYFYMNGRRNILSNGKLLEVKGAFPVC